MNWWLRKLLADFREGYGCPPPAEPDWEPPCRLCRLADAVLAEKWQTVSWDADTALVGTVGDVTLVVEQTAVGWAWRAEKPGPGFTNAVVGEGVEKGLMDALYAAERCTKETA